MSRLWATLIALDQLFNAIINASPDETFSAACFRKAQNGNRRWVIMRNVIDAVFFWDKGENGEKHCHLSWLQELRRGHFPNDYFRR